MYYKIYFKEINRLFEAPCGLILLKDLEYFEDTFFVDDTFMFYEHELGFNTMKEIGQNTKNLSFYQRNRT